MLSISGSCPRRSVPRDRGRRARWRLAQAGDQFLAQGTPRQGVEAGVNGLGGDPPLRGIRPHHLHGAGDLTGRPTLPQKMFDHAKQHAIYRQLGRPPRLESGSAALPGQPAGRRSHCSPGHPPRWACRRHSRLIVEGARCRVRAMARRRWPSWAITMIVARSSADSCSKCLVITTPISVEVLHLILDSAQWPYSPRCRLR
jgi:hypothetical protein